jgi:peptide/nickel transport system permease protein
VEGSVVTRYLLRRLAWALVTLWGISLLTFLAIFVVPGDPAAVLAPKGASPELRQSIRRELGLDRPVLLQYAAYVGRAARGDLGRSYVTGERVAAAIARRVPPTALLALSGWAVWLLVGTALGMAAAVAAGRWPERLVLGFGILGASLPTFWVGIVLLYLFASRLPWLPAGGYGTPAHLVLPTLTLGLSGAAAYSRIVHASLRGVLGEDYIRTARAKGLDERQVIGRHALRNALLPLATLAGADLAALFGGVVVTESVFAWPGIGQLAVQAVLNLDVPMIMGTVLFSAALVVAANLAVDLLYPQIDPRILRQ